MGKTYLCGLCLVLAAGWVGGCATPDRNKQFADERTAAISSLQPISYRRMGGSGNADDLIKIGRDGKVEASGRLLGQLNGQLSELQMMQLAMLFDGWGKLAGSYPASENQPNAAVITIQYADKPVTASDSAKAIPEQFALARAKLENIVKQLPQSK